MKRLVVDPSLIDRLSELRDPVELCDVSGSVLGQFTPSCCTNSDLAIPFSDEELARRRQETTVYTTEEVLARLRAS